MITFKKSMAAALLAGATVLTLIGCSSSPSTSSSGSSSDTASTAASGGTVKIMVFGTFSKPPFPLVQIKDAAEAAVKHVNAAGGINGTQIQLEECDDNMTPDGATACGQQAVKDGVAAVVGTFTLFGDAIVPQLEKAKIPYILPVAISAKEVASTETFAVMSSGAPLGAGIPILKQQGCTSIVLAATDNPQSHANFTAYGEPVAKNLGVKLTLVTYPADTTDYTSVAQQIANTGDCVIYGGGAPDSAAIITALAQTGKKLINMPLSTIAFPESTLSQLGDAANGVEVPSTFYFPSTGKSAVTTAVSEIQAVDSKAVIDDTALNSYAAVLTFAQAAAKVKGAITGSAVAAVLSDPSTTIDTGLYPPVNFSKQFNFFPPSPRVAGSTFIIYKAEGGKYVQDGDPVDVTGKLGF